MRCTRRALRSLLAHLPQDAVEAAAQSPADEFPWVDVLPRADRHQFVTDFARSFQASAELGNWGQYEVTAGGRIWYRPDVDRGVVWIAAGTGHPKITD